MSEILENPRARTAKPAPTMTLGEACDKLWQLREDKRKADAESKRIEAEIKGDEEKGIVGLERTVIYLLDSQGTRKAEGRKASVSITESTVGNVEDWEALWPYIAKNKFWHLIQKRVSDPALRELWALKKVVPGVQPFTKRTVSVRSL
jgi:hypothetical protein